MMSDELKETLKLLVIRVADAMGLWRGTKEEAIDPPWFEKEVTIINYLTNPGKLDELITVIQNILTQFPDRTQFGLVTRGFVVSTLGLLRDYRFNEFKNPDAPEETLHPGEVDPDPKQPAAEATTEGDGGSEDGSK